MRQRDLAVAERQPISATSLQIFSSENHRAVNVYSCTMVIAGGLGGDGEMVWEVSATIFDDFRVADRLTQEQIEQEQFIDFAKAAQERRELPQIESCRRPLSDPPDLLVTARGREYRVELTSLTAPEVSRQRLSDVRALGRNLSELVRADVHRFAHLIGTKIILAEMASDDQRPPKVHARRMNEVVTRIADALGPEIGTVSPEYYADPANPPLTLPRRQGWARVDDIYSLEVHPASNSTAAPNVIANCQVRLSPSLLGRIFIERVKKKDRRESEFLLMTTGLPDKNGYVCPADHFVFHLLREQVVDGKLRIPQPRHLRQIVVNHWRQPPLTFVVSGEDGLLSRAST